MTKISIILPVYNREDLIKPCVDSLLHQTANDYEIIIVDDCSTDKTNEILSNYRDQRLRLLNNKIQSGPSFSRNRAAQEADGEILAFIDSDCVAHADWIEKLASGFRENLKVGIVGGQILEPRSGNYWQSVNTRVDFVAKKKGPVKKVIGCNMAITREFFLENKFDENIFPSEELDLCIRCLKQDKIIYYIPEAQVVHFRRSGFLSTAFQQFRYGLFNTYVNLKNKMFPFISGGAGLLILTCISLVFLDIRIAFGCILVYLSLTLYIGITEKDLRIRKLAIIYPGFLIACLSNSIGSLCGLPLGVVYLLKKK